MLVPEDELHATAKRVADEIVGRRVVTSQMVLAELLGDLAERGGSLREAGCKLVLDLLASPNVTIISQTSRLFLTALELYRDRPDKAWSLVDCASFVIMRRRRIRDALAHDHHFEQAGFVPLLRQ
jgi:predicted nucleic acid-binding protein